ncbi:MAG: D-alanine--D-alanine ligase [Alphaproteobacteria bacterium]|nr:D-alanine--D-alanine ligase [Alphaproteobacteria bacterium]
MSKRVAVLLGGISSERDVSLVSGTAVAGALRDKGYNVVEIDVSDDITAIINALNPAPDAVFNALHGRYGEDGCMQGMLDLLNIPYTHSGVLSSALAMDKPVAKRLFEEAGIPCAEHVIASREEVLAGHVMEPPYVMKPLNEGSSVGVQIVSDEASRAAMTDTQWTFGNKVMVEKYIPGREITVAVMGDQALGVTELRTDDGFYDYEAKYTEGRTTHIVPAPLPPPIYKAAMAHARAAHETLGCRGVTRADLRYDDTQSDPGSLIMLEINTQPGMTPLSLVPEQAAHAGIEFGDLVSWMVENAACRS